MTDDGELDGFVTAIRGGRAFAACTLDISTGEAKRFQQLRRSPPRFTPKCFEGDWSITDSHPASGQVRLVGVVKVSEADKMFLVAKQGASLYAAEFAVGPAASP